MNQMLLLAGLLVVGVASSLEAASVDCVADVGCPKVEKGIEQPKECCKPLPCELQLAYDVAWANQYNVQNLALAFADAEGAEAEMDYAGKLFGDFSELLDQIQLGLCPEDTYYKEPPQLSARDADQCEIMYFEDFDKKIGSVSLDDLHQDSNACSELVEAKYKKATVERDICLVNLKRTEPRTLNERIQQDMAKANAEVEALDSHLQQYWSRCSVTPPVEPAQEVVDDDLVALTPDPPKKAKKQKAAKKKGPPKKSKKPRKSVKRTR